MSRYRNRTVAFGQVPGESIWYDRVTGKVIFHNHFSNSSGNQYESCKDTVTPNWSKKISNGEIVNNYFHYVKTKYFYPSGFSVETGPTVQQHYYGANSNICPHQLYFGHLSLDKSFDTSGCLANVDSTPYEMGEDILEIRETLKFLRNPLSSILDISRAFSKTRRKLQSRGLSREKALANAWLQYRFALMPLILSAENIAEGLQADFKFPERRIARSTFSSNDQKDTTVTDAYGWKAHTSLTGAWVGRCGLCYIVTNPAGYWRSVFGLRAKDVPAALWAIVPYSFLVDRLINISSAIKGILNLSDPDVHILYGWKTGNDEAIVYSRRIEKIPTPYSSSSAVCDGGGLEETRVSHERIPWKPTFGDTIPKPNWGGLVSSVTRITDLVSLIIQRFR